MVNRSGWTSTPWESGRGLRGVDAELTHYPLNTHTYGAPQLALKKDLRLAPRVGMYFFSNSPASSELGSRLSVSRPLWGPSADFSWLSLGPLACEVALDQGRLSNTFPKRHRAQAPHMAENLRGAPPSPQSTSLNSGPGVATWQTWQLIKGRLYSIQRE